MRGNDLIVCKLVLLFAALFGVFAIETFAWAQPKQTVEKYERKSISYINQILFTSPQLQMPEERKAKLIAKVRKEVEMPRFDYNELSDSLLKDFALQWQSFLNQAKVEKEAMLQSAAEILTNTVAPGLLEILNDPVVQKLRAGQMVDEVERQKFIVEKAKETGITAEDLEKVINSAYLYMIVVTDYRSVLSEDEKTKKKTVTYHISGGVVWFKLEPEAGKIKVMASFKITEQSLENLKSEEVPEDVLKKLEGIKNQEITVEEEFLDILKGTIGEEQTVRYKSLILKHAFQIIETSSSGQADPDREYAVTPLGKAATLLDVSMGEKIGGDEYAFRQAMDTFAKNIGLEVARMFPVTTGVVHVAGSEVSFGMGKAEGLYIDQKFLVYEKQKRGDKIIEKKKGFFYVSKVGDNTPDERGFRKDELSRGKLIIRGAEPGMDVREYPTTNVDFSIRFKMGGVNIGSGFLSSDGCGLNVVQEVRSNIAALSGAFQYNTARYLKIPQLFATVGADIGIAPVENVTIKPYNVWGSEEISLGTYVNFHFSLLKKFYIGRVALYAEPLAGLQIFDISGKGNGENKTSFSNKSKAFLINSGVELALREDINIGFLTSFRFPIGEQNLWSGYYTPDEGKKAELFSDFMGPEVAYPNPFFGVYLNYSLPTFWNYLPNLSGEIIEGLRKD